MTRNEIARWINQSVSKGLRAPGLLAKYGGAAEKKSNFLGGTVFILGSRVKSSGEPGLPEKK